MRNKILLAFLSLCVLFTFPIQAQLIISEFMASNGRALLDEDREYSDWIEIQNVSFSNVNLAGWSLTDSAGNPEKWSFPATNLPPGDFLVVFASGKNRRVAGANLHANFNLAAGGEYLALIGPDGTVATAFSPEYPQQVPDVSYGFGAVTTNITLITSNSQVRVKIPSSSAEDAAWATNTFDDSGWTQGQNGVGFGSANVAQADYSLAVIPTDPLGYWRLNESSGSAAANSGSGNLPGTYTSVTLGTAGPRPPQFNGFEPNNNAPTFSAGHVSVAGSPLSSLTRFTLSGWVKSAGNQANRTGLFGQNDAVEFGFIDAGTIQCWTPGGGFVNASVSIPANTWFHLAAIGDGTSIRVYTNGVLAASGGAGVNGTYGSSSFPFNIGGGGIFDTTGNNFNGQIDEVSLHTRALTPDEIRALYDAGLNPPSVSVAPYVRTDVSAAMSNVNASAYIRIPFDITDAARVALLTLKLRYDDGFVAYINGQEILRANAPGALAFNSAATAEHVPVIADEFRIGPTFLVSGRNVLSIHGLNRAANDPDFLILAELAATLVEETSDVPLYFTRSTPGEANSAGVAIVGPAVIATSHSPNVPSDTQDLIVTAHVVPTFNTISNVVMRYRVMFGTEVQVPMFDDGAHGDGAANDGIFGATIPSSEYSNSQMVRWFFRATDVNGNTSRWPLFVNPANGAEYLGTMVDYEVESKLPVVHLFAPANVLRAGVAEANGSADTEAGGRVAVFFDGEFYDNVHMSLRGNTTASYNKKSHRLEFNNEHPFRHPGADRRIRHTSFVADFPDPSYMRQGLSYWLGNLMGLPSPFYYPMRLQLNGQFYQLANHNDVLDQEQLDRLGYDDSGALYKAAGQVTPSKQSTGGFEKLTRRGESDADYVAMATAINEANPLAVRTTNFFELFDIPNVINYAVLARWVHENDDVWANMTLFHDLFNDGLWRIIPFDMNLSWGAIFAEGDVSLYNGVQATNDNHKAHPLYGSSQALALSGPGGGFNRVYDVIFQSPVLREMYLRRVRTFLDEFIKQPGTPENSTLVEQKILAWRDLIAEEALRDRAKWGWPNRGGQSSFLPGIQITNAVDELLEQFFHPRRNHYYIKHSVANTALPIGITKDRNAGIPFPEPPNATPMIGHIEFNPASGNQLEEYIVITNNTPFAIDLSGWQLTEAIEFTFKAGTVIPSGMSLYVVRDINAFRNRTTGPRGGMGLFVLGNYDEQLSARGEPVRLLNRDGVEVATRNYPGTPSLAQQSLRITEIMYNPAGTAGDTRDPQDYEYIEVQNVSSNATLDLTGVAFTAGINFDFTGSAITTLAPGARALVVRDIAAFTARYGAGLPIAGQYGSGLEGGFLDNNGERIRLVDPVGEEILDFEYSDTWYPITDGHGFSLVRIDPNAVLNQDNWRSKSGWRPSSNRLGSPGQLDPALPTIGQVVINEVLSRTVLPQVDTVELHNLTDQAVNIGGWFITDDFNSPRKFQIPAGTSIPAGGYIVFTEEDFGVGANAFQLSSDGDEIYLFSAANGELTGYVHGFQFGSAATGVSFGRHITSNGAEHFVPQAANTLGAVNSQPRVGPLIVSEIMYNASELDLESPTDEYIEIMNISSNTVILGNETQTVWRVSGGADLDFPVNTTIAPGEIILLVNFDPSSAELLAEFRAKYSVPASVAVYGPLDGRLSGGGDTINLRTFSDQLEYIAEHIEFEDAGQWHDSADGFGASLHRLLPATYANDPANWVGAAPSPGRAYGGGTPPVITLQSPSTVTGNFRESITINAAVSGAEPLYVYWESRGVIWGTNATLTLTNLHPSMAGEFQLWAYNAAGTAAASEPVEVRVIVPAVILQHPATVEVRPGGSNTFSVVAYSPTPLTYQWKMNGQDIAGETNATLTLNNIGITNRGFYSVVVTDATGSATSQAAELIVLINPFIVQQPQSVTVNAGETIRLTVAVTNTATLPVGYRWRKGGATFTNLAGDFTSHTLVIENAEPSDAGTYSVVVTNAGNYRPGFLSANAIVTVISPPVIYAQPTNRLAVTGTTIPVGVTALGTTPLSYRWYYNGALLTNRTTANFSFSLQATNQGNYHVVITNAYGAVTSTVANIFLDNDRDGVADRFQGLELGAPEMVNGSFRFTITSTTPGPHILQVAESIAGPWRDVGPVTNQVYIDNTINNVNQRFYRILRQD